MLKPTTKFLSNTPERQLNHMTEEMGEIAKALRDNDIVHAREEVADLQLSAETLMYILKGNGEEERDKAIQKNEARNYYSTLKTCHDCQHYKSYGFDKLCCYPAIKAKVPSETAMHCQYFIYKAGDQG